jgi:hypothetical protein
VEIPAHQLTKPPLNAVPGHRWANRPADDKPHPGRLVPGIGPEQQVAHQTRPSGAPPRAHGERELSAVAHPGLGRKDQALSFSRPLCRRAARTARPARVRMRRRKPCVFARRRLFGWNVRLLTGAPGKRSRLWARVTTACGSRIPHRLPSGTAPFARRAPLSGFRLWKAILPKLPQLRCAAGMPRAQHVDSSVDGGRAALDVGM